ncbi:MAG: xylulokinase [Pseudomonadota bacterium]
MFLGVDLGTSSVKAVLIDEAGETRAESAAPLEVSRPEPSWSEQNPDDWVGAAEAAVTGLPSNMRAAVKGVGLSGQMHGATLLGPDDRPLRPAILWNDGRSTAECAELEAAEPRLREITGNKAMPGFTAPKLLWVREHEPEIFAKTARILLPKDYLRLAWTGEAATDASDASGTLWLDVGARAWSDAALAASGLTQEQMPTVHEGTELCATLSAAAADRLGLPQVPVAAGAGDQAAGAVGAGVVDPGEASLALGTSGVLFVVSKGFKPNPEEATHAFCHAVPERWHQMAVILSAASAVDWAARLTGYGSPAEAYAAAEVVGSSGGALFLPYLTGERTPHDFAAPAGAFFGLSASTDRATLAHAALEGVAFALADGADALRRAGGTFDSATVIGGGARSYYWGRILAGALNLPLTYREGAETGPAHGAARLARIAVTGESVDAVCGPAPIRSVIEPNPGLVELYQTRLSRWRALFNQTKDLFVEGSAP